jgi:hypothetical protein
MYLVAIAWMYVVLMMAVAEALSSQGTLLGAFFTLVLYGLLPLGILLYIMGTPMRRRSRGQQATPQGAPGAPMADDSASADSAPPDGRSMPPGDTVAAKGKKA